MKKIGTTRFIGLLLALLFCLQFTVACGDSEESDVVLKVAIISDTHIGKNYVTPLPEIKLASALDKTYERYGKTDGLIIAGDLTESGQDAEYELFNKVLEEHVQEETKLLICMGNHEYFRSTESEETHDKAIQEIYKKYVHELDTDDVINGYHFIGISPRNAYANYEENSQFLIDHVKAAAKESPDKPIFVYSHEGFGKIYAHEGSTFKKEVDDLMEEYPQIIAFSGHTHYPINDPQMIQQEKITTIQTSTVGADYWNYYMFEDFPDHPPFDGYLEASQGLYMTVTKDNIVTVERYDYTYDQTVGQNWVIDVPSIIKSRENFSYTDEKRFAAAKAPAFPADGKIRLSALDVGSVKGSFTTATVTDEVSDDAVMRYRVKCVNKLTKKTEDESFVFADYYKGPKRAKTLEFEFTDLTPYTDYELYVTAISVFDKESKPLKLVFRTKNLDSVSLSDLPDALLSVDYASGSAADKVSGNAPETVGTPQLKDGQVLLENGSAYLYDLSDAAREKMTDGFCIETMLYVNRDQSYNYGTVDLLSNYEYGGFSIEIEEDNDLLCYVSVDGEDYMVAKEDLEPERWHHIVLTFDGKALSLFVDGVRYGKEDCEGSFTPSDTTARKIAAGGDVSDGNLLEDSSNVSFKFIRIYEDGLNAAQVLKLKAEASAAK